MADGDPAPVAGRHVVLVGLPGAGKSTVGPLVAARLGLPFLDLDVELVRRDGRPIARQFAEDGEPAFRAREAAISVELARAAPHVLAPGGGWLANAAASTPLRGAGVVVYLRTTPAAALDRLGPERATRPLLAGPDPLAALDALLERRRAGYESADVAVGVDGRTPEEVAAAVVRALRPATADAGPPAARPSAPPDHPPVPRGPDAHR